MNYSEEIEKSSVAVRVCNFLSVEKSIDVRQCQGLRSDNANLKGTVKTLPRSLGRCYFWKEWKCKYCTCKCLRILQQIVNNSPITVNYFHSYSEFLPVVTCAIVDDTFKMVLLIHRSNGIRSFRLKS